MLTGFAGAGEFISREAAAGSTFLVTAEWDYDDGIDQVLTSRGWAITDLGSTRFGFQRGVRGEIVVTEWSVAAIRSRAQEAAQFDMTMSTLTCTVQGVMGLAELSLDRDLRTLVLAYADTRVVDEMDHLLRQIAAPVVRDLAQ